MDDWPLELSTLHATGFDHLRRLLEIPHRRQLKQLRWSPSRKYHIRDTESTVESLEDDVAHLVSLHLQLSTADPADHPTLLHSLVPFM